MAVDADGRATLPGVSYVMPVLNEVQYIERAVRSILDQEYPGPTEIVLALGPSSDGTNDVVKKLVADDPRIHTVDNPRAAIPAGLNLAIDASSHPIIVRVDAHAQLPAGYTHRAVDTLLRVNADNVTDKRYWSTGGTTLYVGLARTVRASATFDF